MQITEEQKVTETKQVIIGYKCDICKKYHSKGKPLNEYPDNWHYFNHRHEGWDNDSIDSVEWFLVCSPECYFKQLKKSLKIVGEYHGAEIDDKEPSFIKDLLKYINGIIPKT